MGQSCRCGARKPVSDQRNIVGIIEGEGSLGADTLAKAMGIDRAQQAPL